MWSVEEVGKYYFVFPAHASGLEARAVMCLWGTLDVYEIVNS